MPTFPRSAFRLGSTSYVYPGDLLYNVERLAGQVQDVELVLFETARGESNIPAPAEVKGLRAALAGGGLSVTVHLPADLACHPARRAQSLEQARRVIELTALLEPAAWVFHLETEGAGSQLWQDEGIRALEALMSLAPAPHTLALENLESYSPDLLEPVFAALPIARTLDIGHLWKADIDPGPIVERWLPEARVVHLHGCTAHDGRAHDHLSLACVPNEVLDPIIERLRTFTGVLTLEVFEDDFFTSRAALHAALERRP